MARSCSRAWVTASVSEPTPFPPPHLEASVRPVERASRRVRSRHLELPVAPAVALQVWERRGRGADAAVRYCHRPRARLHLPSLPPSPLLTWKAWKTAAVVSFHVPGSRPGGRMTPEGTLNCAPAGGFVEHQKPCSAMEGEDAGVLLTRQRTQVTHAPARAPAAARRWRTCRRPRAGRSGRRGRRGATATRC